VPTRYQTTESAIVKRVAITSSGPTGVAVPTPLPAGTKIVAYAGATGVSSPGSNGTLPAYSIFLVAAGQGTPPFPSHNCGFYSEQPLPIHTIGTVDFE